MASGSLKLALLAAAAATSSAAAATSSSGAAAATRADPFVLPARAQRLPGGGCSLTADYVDNGGGYARIVDSAGALNVTALSPEGWGPWVAGSFDSASLAGWVNFGAADNLTFTATAGCTALSFSNGETWRATQPLANITTVHAVFMTHLDVGFTLLANDVCEQCMYQSSATSPPLPHAFPTQTLLSPCRTPTRVISPPCNRLYGALPERHQARAGAARRGRRGALQRDVAPVADSGVP